LEVIKNQAGLQELVREGLLRLESIIQQTSDPDRLWVGHSLLSKAEVEGVIETLKLWLLCGSLGHNAHDFDWAFIEKQAKNVSRLMGEYMEYAKVAGPMTEALKKAIVDGDSREANRLAAQLAEVNARRGVASGG
jgi:hypothetical protein